MRGDEVIENADVVVRGNRIVAVGPRGVKAGTAELKARAGREAEALSFESVSARLIGG